MKNNCFMADISMKKYERTFRYNDVEVLKLTIKYPVVNMMYNPHSEIVINNQISTDVREYMRYAGYLYKQAVNFYHDSKKNDFPFHTYEAYMEYTVTYNENCFLSMYYDKYEFTGGAHGNTVRSSHTWELCSSMLIELCNLFRPGTDYKYFLTDKIIAQAGQNLRQNPGIYFGEYESLIVKNFNENSFYLTPEGLTLYYQQYDIAPYSTGIVQFTIPYSEIQWYPRCSF
ncbi:MULTISPECIES: DUF3298 and DUF4163 domain-containing protein [unclassified Sedimentibacter]|uniref:DUF3298 and DUF4163 domain-containing protein n=1 Tax=unclassified Sedimentibacter TaxID=2649220 RepID=UPI0027E01FA1|nr:DUF3298 and DUF4163 domain-containing protein [Sedimentibacter sp. MB35-C1]WMJ77428.1 DUF3298 and DUF4163 domain-containing protein [Sedimentibacter sp. MB35-C1]